jgi:hypothetical protein
LTIAGALPHRKGNVIKQITGYFLCDQASRPTVMAAIMTTKRRLATTVATLVQFSHLLRGRA